MPYSHPHYYRIIARNPVSLKITSVNSMEVR